MKIIGIEKIDYTRKSDSAHIYGIKLYCGVESPHVQGLKPEELFISGKSPYHDDAVCVAVGDEVCVYYDKAGRIASFTVK